MENTAYATIEDASSQSQVIVEENTELYSYLHERIAAAQARLRFLNVLLSQSGISLELNHINFQDGLHATLESIAEDLDIALDELKVRKN